MRRDQIHTIQVWANQGTEGGPLDLHAAFNIACGRDLAGNLVRLQQETPDELNAILQRYQ